MKLTLTIALIMTAIAATAQDEIEIPTLTSIEVNEEGIPVLHWTMQNPDLVDGYIIKRLIVDGQGVIPGTYNNVAIIDDNNTFTYTDRSGEYGTYAMTNIRQEYYRLAAYKTDHDGKIHYSLMSEPTATMTAQGSYNPCDHKYSLQYSSIENADHYTLHLIEPERAKYQDTKDTTTSIDFQTYHQSRTFQIECTTTNGIHTYSPQITIEATQPTPPETVAIDLITTDDQNQIQLTLTATPTQHSSEAQLLRHDIATGADSTLILPSTAMTAETITDNYADPTTRYSYILTITDQCGQPLAQSDTAHNIVATATPDAQTSNIIAWNPPTNSTTPNHTTQIARKIDDGDWQDITQVSGFYDDYQDMLANIIADENLYEGRFYYRIAITTPDGKTMRSNTACLQRDPIIYIPNALNPNSDRQDNRTFRPRADFLLDYHMTIYDKRGALIFQSDDLNTGWDGYDRSSKLCHRDTYVYHITYKTSSGKQISKSGMVNLLY